MAMREIAKSMIGKNVAGSIVVLSSIRSIVVEPGQSAYAATKAGLVQLVRGLCSEVGKNNIRVNAIAPGVVDTPLTQQIKRIRTGTGRTVREAHLTDGHPLMK